MQPPPPLRIDSLTVRYEDAERPVPDSASLYIQPGQVILVLGPSGSGKSTLALAACRLIPHANPAAIGVRALVAGLNTREHKVAELSTRISMVFQDPDAQIVTGTVLDEVCFGPENLALPVNEVLVRSERALRTVGLRERRGENPDHLSGGGKLCIVIVLDEPAANLDPAGVIDVNAALAEVISDGEHSLLLIEHNLDACINLVDQLVVIDRTGRPAMTGTVDEVLREQAHELVALGVWMPVATCAALQLKTVGVSLDPLPTNPAELAAALDTQPNLPKPAEAVNAEPHFLDAPMVSVQGLSVAQNGRTVLASVDLEVAHGAFLAVVGGNGAGKSTLLHAIAGVAPPPRGTVRIDWRRSRRRQRARAFPTSGIRVPEPRASVHLRHRCRRTRAHAPRPRCPRADHPQPSQPDAGAPRPDRRTQLAPVPALGRPETPPVRGTALIGGARVLVLDEPTYGQDQDRAAELLDLLSALRDEGTTVIAATHNLRLVAVLAEGRILTQGPTGSVLSSAELVEAGLLPPPLVTAMRSLRHHPAWRTIIRLPGLPKDPR